MESEREATVERLRAMPGYLAEVARRIGEAEGTRSPDDGGFSLVEHMWHLADLEEEAFAVRIRRIREEEAPALADFDGARLAAEREYRLRRIEDGLAAFTRARLRNVATLRQITASEWSRRATQDEVGPLTLEDLPRMMAEHDDSHRAEIEELVAVVNGTPGPP